MDESVSSPEKGALKERSFNVEADLCPLEHMLIGSSFVFPGKERKTFNKETIKRDKILIRDPDFLLRPFGLTTGESDIEGIKARRSQIRSLNGWYPCFKLIREFHLDYEFYYDLNEPDENGRMPNEFKFRFRERGSENFWDKSNPQDLESFRKITLSPGSSTYAEGKPFFSLTKDEDKGTLTLTFMPLLENIKQ